MTIIDDGDGDYLIEFPSDFIIIPRNDVHNNIIQNIYSDLSSKLLDRKYLNERTILVPTNEIVDALNERILSSISAEEVVYLSAISICKISSNYAEEDLLYPIEFLNSLKFFGFPNHELKLKIGIPVILLRNLNQNTDLYNGTRLVITRLFSKIIEAEFINRSNIGDRVFISRVILSPTESK